MSTTVTYKGSTLTTVDNQTRTLKTAGKYMEGDVILVDVTESGSGSGVVWQDGQGYIHLSDEGDIELQTKTVTPTETAQTITADAGYYALEKVNVGAISNTYVGTGITRRSSSDLTASGATVTVPSGYYSAQASKAVASGTEGTPTATKGAVSNHQVSVTPSVTNTSGYITGSTKTGTAVTVTASELVSGSKSITANGTGIDVTNYASVDVSVSGSITPVTVTVTTSRRGDIIVGPLYKDLEDSDNPAIGYSLATGSWASSGLPFRILFDSNFSNQIIYISTSSATITAGNNVEVGETWTLGNCTCQNLYIQGDNAAFIVR